MFTITNLSSETTSYVETISDVGDYYYLIVAYNLTRGEIAPANSLVHVEIQDIAKSPETISLTTNSELQKDGKINVQFQAFPGTTYGIYGMVDEKFTLSDVLSEESEVESLGYFTATSEDGYDQVTVPSSGNWSISIWASNSTGEAETLSGFDSILIGKVPIQPEIYLSSNNPHNSSVVSLEWDEADEADYYILYRVDGEVSGAVYGKFDNLTRLEPLYNGSETSFIDSEKKKSNWLYFYTVVAYNENGHREVDLENGKYVQAKIVLSQTGLSDSYTGLIIGASVVGALAIGWYIYKKRRPWASL